MLDIREGDAESFHAFWPIFQTVVKGGEAYAIPPDISFEDGRAYWEMASKKNYYAYLDGELVGGFFIRPVQMGPGSHVANAGFMVSPDHRGKGIAREMATWGLTKAKELGFEAMQYNVVVGSNEPAVKLWQSFDFEIIGTVPDGFKRPNGEYSDIYIMYKRL